MDKGKQQATKGLVNLFNASKKRAPQTKDVATEVIIDVTPNSCIEHHIGIGAEITCNLSQLADIIARLQDIIDDN